MTALRLLAAVLLVAAYGNVAALAQDVDTEKATTPGGERPGPRKRLNQLANQLDRSFMQAAVARPVNEAPKELSHEAFRKILEKGLVADELMALLAFEEEHRGDHVGLMALRKILSHAARFAPPPPKPLERARSEAMQRLRYYASLPIAAETVCRVMGGYPDRGVEAALRDVIDAPDVKPNVREAARLTLARWMLSWESFVKHRKQSEKQVPLLKQKKGVGEDGLPHVMKARITEYYLALTPTDEEFAKWKDEAETMLADLESDADSIRIPAVKNADKQYHIVRIDQEATRKKATIARLATIALHRRMGAKAEKLQAQLIDDSQWELADQSGKVTVIQFSFTGCAPCARMYPRLADLLAKHSNSLSVLTIMRDDAVETTKKTVAEYKIDWPVCWDGSPGRITQHWGVSSFPRVFVIDRHGKIAGTSLESAKRLLNHRVTEEKRPNR